MAGRFSMTIKVEANQMSRGKTDVIFDIPRSRYSKAERIFTYVN
jgi:hypothetical protein